MNIKTLTRSLWAFHVCCSPCNNCDIEILDTLTPRYDLERFGIQLVGSIRHADILLVSGVVNKKNVSRLKRIYEQAPKPILVVAIGNCACSEILFRNSYNACGPVDKIIPVDAYVPGCPPKPEAMIMGIVKLIKTLHDKK
ncbi:MAG: NADH:ubiquinone oxidoreductase [Elusimicrobia bacterium RIFOXYC2_FULL_34_12]|nr:MAG: NADH:ubiquinone oxidoreductase [Elusimicrobia bacterium RIFOXYC2_FULL_34_12]HAM37990.1 NADH:ubiquinone oxidoreductase [Elusimicrobiota bacterium]